MITFYRQFLYGLKWNTIGSLVYQIVYIVHHIALFRTVDHAFYGIVGALFSIIFLAVPLCNLGFNLSLAPFFIRFTASRSRFNQLFTVFFALNTLCIIALVGVVYHYRALVEQCLFQKTALEPHFVALLCVIFITESMHKTLRTLAQLAFYTRASALLEIAKILIYCALVWGWHATGNDFTLMSIFAPMLIISLGDLIGLVCVTLRFYRTLPRIPAIPVPRVWYWSMFTNRSAMYAHETLSLIFSHNFLVPFFAATIGFSEAGIFKFISQVTIFVTVVLQKIIGMTSNAFLCHTKNLPLTTKREVFSVTTNWLYQILYGIIIFLAINSCRLIAWQSSHALTCDLSLIYLFMFTSLSDNFLLTYHKFYITEEKAQYLAYINASTILLFVGLVHFSGAHAWSRESMYLGVLVLRLIAFAATGLLAYLLWRITPAWRINIRYGVAVTLFSLLFFLVA